MEQAGNDGGLVANRVEPNGPGEKAGIRAGDQLTAINQHDVKDTTARMRQVYRVGRLVEGDLFAGTAVRPAGYDRHPDSRRALTELLAALHRPDLPGHRALCSAAALDGAEFHPLLYLLPGLVHFLRLQVHRETEPV